MDAKSEHVPGGKALEVPESLVGELHEAGAELTQCREKMETVLDDYEKGLEAREQSIDEVRRAGERVDEVGRKVTETIDSSRADAPPDLPTST